MKLKLTREQVFQIWYVLQELKIPEDEKLDKRFDYARNRNLTSLAPEVSELIKARNSGVPRFDEYTKKRMDLLTLFADKDENGNPIIVNNQYSVPLDKTEESNKAIQELFNEYKDAIEERQKEIELYNEIIKEEIEVDITQVSFTALPAFVSTTFTAAIRPIIKESDEEIEALL